MTAVVRSRDGEAALRLAKRLALSLDDVVGVDLGFVYQEHMRTEEVGVRFHFRNKLSPDRVPADQLVPRKVEGVPTDVLASSFGPQQARRRRSGGTAPVRPLRIGQNIGNKTRFTSGTLGLPVTPVSGSGRYALSNWHVLAGAVNAHPGEEIVQPTSFAIGEGRPRRIGVLSAMLKPTSGFDAALVELDADQSLVAKGMGLDLPVDGTEPPELGTVLAKYGAMTKLTYGLVDGIGGAYLIDYSAMGLVPAWMQGVRLVADPAHPPAGEEISMEGDSGALWINPDTGRAAALHFAGEDYRALQHEYALAHPIERILELMEIEPIELA